jgi:hypothetical protein
VCRPAVSLSRFLFFSSRLPAIATSKYRLDPERRETGVVKEECCWVVYCPVTYRVVEYSYQELPTYIHTLQARSPPLLPVVDIRNPPTHSTLMHKKPVAKGTKMTPLHGGCRSLHAVFPACLSCLASCLVVCLSQHSLSTQCAVSYLHDAMLCYAPPPPLLATNAFFP